MTLSNLSGLSGLSSLTDAAPVTKPALGAFLPYDSQLPLAEEEGNRVVKCLYQVITSGPNKGTKKQDNAYTRVPTKHLTEEVIIERVSELSPYILGWLQGLENEAIKKYHSEGGINYHVAGLSFDALVEMLEASDTGSRLNKEKITEWFNTVIKDNLTELFAERMGLDENSTDAEVSRLEVVLAAYLAKFCSLAGGKAFIKEADCKAMIEVITAADLKTSLIGKRFVTRLTKMHEAKEDELLLSL